MSTKEVPKHIIRNLQLSDCPQVLQLWTDVGFVLAKYKNEIMLNVDPKGLFVAQEVKSGQILGVCCGINLSPELAFLGGYCVRKEYQGLGIGDPLWKTVMDYMGPERNVGLCAQPHMLTKYRDRYHFKAIPDKLLAHFVGKVNTNNMIESIGGIVLSEINDKNIEEVIQYDKQVCNGLDRSLLIKEFTKTPETYTLVAINQNQEVLGYCVVCPTNIDTLLVEPLYADNETIAELLVNKCLQKTGMTSTKDLLYLCWDSNHKSIAIAEKMGLKNTRKQPTAFTKKVVEGQVDKIYCISSRIYYPF